MRVCRHDWGPSHVPETSWRSSSAALLSEEKEEHASVTEEREESVQ
jgi:hypothetical protein